MLVEKMIGGSREFRNNTPLLLSNPHMTPQRWDLVWEGVSEMLGISEGFGTRVARLSNC